MNRAWRTTWSGIASIVSATTRGRAIAATLGSLHEVGYRAEWKEIRCIRAPEFDGWASRGLVGCFTEEYLPRDARPADLPGQRRMF